MKTVNDKEMQAEIRRAIEDGMDRVAAIAYEAAAKLVELIGEQHRGEGVEANKFCKIIADRIRKFPKGEM